MQHAASLFFSISEKGECRRGLRVRTRRVDHARTASSVAKVDLLLKNLDDAERVELTGRVMLADHFLWIPVECCARPLVSSKSFIRDSAASSPARSMASSTVSLSHHIGISAPL
jgi:hypothetical protein